MKQIGAFLEDTSTPAHDEEQAKHDASDQVSEPRHHPASPQIPEGGTAGKQSQGHEHGMAGEQFRAGENDEGESNSETAPHHQISHRRVHILTNAEY